jgi:Copper transport outer membrane protein, MctB
MGYSARYHATSLIAVFLSLAIGILIGAEFGGDALTGTRRDLENSLVGNLQDARSQADQLGGELARANEFGDRVYPVLIQERLEGKRIGVLAFGGLPSDQLTAVEAALAPTGARLVGVGVVREPADLGGMASDLSSTRLSDLKEDPESLTILATGVGRQLVVGGTLPEAVRGHLFSRASGSFGALDGVIVVRSQPQDMGPVQRSTASQLEAGMLNGMKKTFTPLVGIETTSAEPSSISFYKGNDVSSVDDVELTAGKLAMVFALLGSDGNFGTKSSADRFLPDLLAPGS